MHGLIHKLQKKKGKHYSNAITTKTKISILNLVLPCTLVFF